MSETPTDPPDTGPIDVEVLDRVAAHLARSTRFEAVESRPPYAPNAVLIQRENPAVHGGRESRKPGATVHAGLPD